MAVLQGIIPSCSVCFMKAVIIERYGGPEVAQVKDVPKPQPKKGEILIRVMASAVNSGDARLRRADPWFVRLVFGFLGPRKKILGVAFAGIIEALGEGVTNAKVGDRVYGMSENFMGSHAEYMVIKASSPIGEIPTQMSFEEAAAMSFGGTTALHFLDLLDLDGKTLLLNGASGAVGTMVLQIAKMRGATVIAVTSGDNEDLMRSLGADRVIDYKKTALRELNEQFDIVFDCVNAIPINQIESLVKPKGDIVLLAALLKGFIQSRSIKQANVHIGTAKVVQEQYHQLNTMYTEGKLKPVISASYPLDRIHQAYQMVDSGRKVGSIIITMN